MERLTDNEINLIKISLEYYKEFKKDIEKKEMESMIKNDLLLIVDTSCKNLQKLARNLDSISEKLNIKVSYTDK